MPLVDGICQIVVGLYVLQQVALHADGLAGGMQQEPGVVLAVDDAEIELGLSRAVVHHCDDVVHHAVVEGLTVKRDGKRLYSVVLHRLHILHLRDANVHKVAGGIFLLELAFHVDDASLGEHATPRAPLLAKESQLARPLKVFDGHKATGLSLLRKLRFHFCHDTAKSDFLFVEQ